MAPSSATIVTIVGDGCDAVLRELAALPNVHTDHLAGPPLAITPYVVRDADPLEHVASAWVEFFDDRATLGTLELEVETALDALASGRAVMPDYYLVLEPEQLAGTWLHWWLGVLATAAPTRVLPASGEHGAVRRMLRKLPTGRPWPDPDAWLPGLPFAVPDRVGLDHRD